MSTRSKRAGDASLTTKPNKRRRGIVLLVVVSLLALFILMGVAYVIVASHSKTSGDMAQRVEEVGDPPMREMELVLGQLLYDTLGRSSLRFHSLLMDLYGGDAVFDNNADGNADDNTKIGTVVGPALGNQVFAFHVNVAALQANGGPLSPIPDYYSGRIMSFIEGNSAGYSGRILRYDPSLALGPQFTLELDYSSNRSYSSPTVNDHFYINGAPFNGVGAGYNRSTYEMDAEYAGADGMGSYGTANWVSLLPHFSGYDATGGTFPDGTLDAGGLDETWDAVDFQNMALAMVPPTAAGGGVPVIPSFHRPELVNYWVPLIRSMSEFSSGPLDAFDPNNNNPLVTAQLRNMLRTFIFRPMPWEHPNFNGSNPQFDLVSARQQAAINLANNGQPTTEPGLSQETTNILLSRLINSGNLPIWDVDNDNDGIPESIWIDPGLPIITRPDGRRVKRLVAICVKDLDGRIDLNAHGNLAQATELTTGMGDYVYRADYQVPAGFGLITAPAYIPRGIGFGPAEVDFLHIFANDYTAYRNVLRGRYTSNLTGPGPTTDTGVTATPGVPASRDTLSFVKHHGIPNNYSGQYSWYASPPDVWGRGAIVLDYGGQPLTQFMGMNGEMTDTPYEMSLSGQESNGDSPYTLVELERMLCYHDADTATLPSRPLQLATDGSGTFYLASAAQGEIDASEARRNILSGRTSHIPASVSIIPRESRSALYFAGEPYNDLNGNGRWNTGEGYTDINGNMAYDAPQAPAGAVSILDLYRQKLIAAGLTEPTLSSELKKIVPWEFTHGQKFDINRWLGDGFDGNGDGTPDDYIEATAPENAWQAPAAFTGQVAWHSNGMDVNSDNVVNNIDRALARQLYARHLYCLAMVLIPPTFDPPVPHESLSQIQRRQLTVRRLAQWAINCVDFRDFDSIMTAFEYDMNPANGWQVDGNPATDGSATNPERIWDPTSGSVIDVITSERGLVWGMEYPDLLINETFATHDRRVKDTNQDNTAHDRNDTPNNDDDVDQFRVPQGSLFLELYCPRNRYNRNPLLPRELYDYSVATNPRLQLGKLAPGGRPVWRMAISRLIEGDAAQDDVHPATMAGTNAESASYDPFVVNLLPGGTPATPVAIERFAYFGDASGLPGAELAYSYYNSASNPLVEPGQYVVVGPRANTYLGSQDPANANPAAAPGSLWGGNSRQYIQLNAGGITIVDADNNTTSLTPGTDIRPAVPVICDMPGVTPNSSGAPWSMACPWNIGLNITEPLPSGNYYPEPMLSVTPAGATQPDFYDDPEAPTQMFRDTPVESPGAGANSGRPIADRGMTESGPYLNCSSVFLQRLANPSIGFDAVLNPYITVDWATIDVNVFSGEEDSNRTVSGGPANGQPIDPDDNPANQPNDGEPIGTRQRGYRPTPPAVDANFWNPLVSATPGDLPGATATSPYFRFNLSSSGSGGLARHTLAYVNDTVGTPMGAGPNLGEPSNTAGGQTCPWLTWHNRPFSSPMELLLVPSSSAGRICSEFTPGPFAASLTADAYDGAAADEAFRSPVGQLLNFFHTSNMATQADEGAQLARLLDYVEVPSQYVGAERWYNPANFGTAGTYRPPFSKMSRFRDPGRININTIFDERIWYAAMAQFPGTDSAGLAMNSSAFANKVFMSRQGYGSAPPLALNSDYPTRFANPFRTADASDLMPDVPGTGSMSKDRPVDATLLRPAPMPGDAASFDDEPLFEMSATGAGYGHNNTARNPYFRYQAMQKIGNVFTTHSNCYAVWMTMGYFEAEPVSAYNVTANAAHPEGFVIGQEIGADSGEVVRHRAFYIIDRSVPVCFQPGQKHNTDDCVLLRRFIE